MYQHQAVCGNNNNVILSFFIVLLSSEIEPSYLFIIDNIQKTFRRMNQM